MKNEMSEATLKAIRTSTDLVVYPNLLREMSRIVDLFGTLDQYNYSQNESLADVRAMKRDYSLVYEDFKKAVELHERFTKKQRA
jgi:hypothetical protein